MALPREDINPDDPGISEPGRLKTKFVWTEVTNTSEYYTKTEIDNYLYNKSDKSTVTDLTGRVSALEQGSLTIDTSFSSYDELLMALYNTGIPSNKIYLIPSENTEDDNIYDEYIVKDGDLELIGNRILSLDDYLEIGDFSSTLYNKVSLDCVTTHKGVNGATEDSLIIKFNIND